MTGFIHRRSFLKQSSLTATGVFAGLSRVGLGGIMLGRSQELAVFGGSPIRQKKWLDWPIWDRNAEAKILEILRSGNWWLGRGSTVEEFEKTYAELLGAKRCLATASGTTALITSLNALGIDAGDEVLVASYTFIATYNAILCVKALPVFVDTDIATYTMNPEKIEEKITNRTKAILPVHIYGLPADMDRINEIARKHGLAVIEDACQGWLAEYRNQRCGTLGDLGCFSFQNSKNLPAGEGGAITSNNGELMDRCWACHNHGRAYGSIQDTYSINGSNYRMQQFQSAILMSQIKRIEKDARVREQNAEYLTSRLKEIPGLVTLKFSEGATRSANHVYPFRFMKEEFRGLSREKFIAALDAEGVPCGKGYRSPFEYGVIKSQVNSRGFLRLFSRKRLSEYLEQNHLPDNDRLCDEVVTLRQSMLLGSKKDMGDIADALLKIRSNLDKLV